VCLAAATRRCRSAKSRSRGIRFLLHYQDLSGEWVTSDWFQIDAGELPKTVETRNRIED